MKNGFTERSATKGYSARFGVVGAALMMALAFPLQAQNANPPIGQAERGIPAAANSQGGTPASINSQQGAAGEAQCGALPDHSKLKSALVNAVEPDDKKANGGLGNHMWAVVVDRAGIVCTVAFSGDEMDEQWPGSRGIAAEKAFAANGFSVKGFALSTANVYWPAQPGKSLYGVEDGNPVNTEVLYQGPASSWGSESDPLVGKRAGGTIVFGGGLALYDKDGKLLGALGLSGDESCTDHVIAWKLRHALNLDNVPNGVSNAKNDNIIHDITFDPSVSAKTSSSGYGHPVCSPGAKRIADNFNETHPTEPEE